MVETVPLPRTIGGDCPETWRCYASVTVCKRRAFRNLQLDSPTNQHILTESCPIPPTGAANPIPFAFPTAAASPKARIRDEPDQPSSPPNRASLTPGWMSRKVNVRLDL